jgi:hypothetical protein
VLDLQDYLERKSERRITKNQTPKRSTCLLLLPLRVPLSPALLLLPLPLLPALLPLLLLPALLPLLLLPALLPLPPPVPLLFSLSLPPVPLLFSLSLPPPQLVLPPPLTSGLIKSLPVALYHY